MCDIFLLRPCRIRTNTDRLGFFYIRRTDILQLLGYPFLLWNVAFKAPAAASKGLLATSTVVYMCICFTGAVHVEGRDLYGWKP